jgi:hypothetical protein
VKPNDIPGKRGAKNNIQARCELVGQLSIKSLDWLVTLCRVPDLASSQLNKRRIIDTYVFEQC